MKCTWITNLSIVRHLYIFLLTLWMRLYITRLQQDWDSQTFDLHAFGLWGEFENPLIIITYKMVDTPLNMFPKAKIVILQYFSIWMSLFVSTQQAYFK